MDAGQGREIKDIVRPDGRLLWVYLCGSFVLGPFFFIPFIPLCFRYATLKYRFDDQGVAMSWGVLWRREIYLTYARIQDIHLSSGVVERWLGLATIEVQTASAKAGAEMALVGIPEFEKLRDFLYQHMRGAKEPAAHGAAHGPAGFGVASGADGEVVALLTEIRDSVRRVRQKLEGSA